MGNYFDPEERIDWELQKEQQRQKNIARNASKKPKRSGCRLPSDYLTNKQKQDLNGEVKIMNMKSRISWDEFRALSDDLKKEYIEGLQKRFGVTAATIATLQFNVSKGHFCNVVSSLNIERGANAQFMNLDGYKEFLRTGVWPKLPKHLDAITYIDFFSLSNNYPEEEQRQYIRDLFNTYGIRQKDLCVYWNIGPSTITRYLTGKLGMKARKELAHDRQTKEQAKMWNAFLYGGNASVSLEKAAGETNSVSEGSEPISENAPESLENARSETEEEQHDRVIRLLEAGTITVADAEEMLGKKIHVSENKEISTLTETENGDILQHWENAPAKVKRHSGRYPWGEGCEEKTPEEWIAKIRDLKENGKSDKEIADILGMKKLEFQNLMRIAYKERKEREKQYDLNIASLVLQINDLQDWQELFRMLQAMKLPEKNFVYIELKEVIPRTDFTRYMRRPWNPHDTDGIDEE